MKKTMIAVATCPGLYAVLLMAPSVSYASQDPGFAVAFTSLYSQPGYAIANSHVGAPSADSSRMQAAAFEAGRNACQFSRDDAYAEIYWYIPEQDTYSPVLTQQYRCRDLF